PAAFSAAIVLMRAMSRRTWRTRAVFSIWPVAFWKRRLNCSFFSLISSSLSWSGVSIFTSLAFIAPTPSLAKPRHEARLDRKLRRRKGKRFFSDLAAHAVDLEQDPARLHPAGPVFRRALARAHAHFGRLLRHRHIREHADPHAPGALHAARQGPAGRFDLARGEALRLLGLEAEGAEIQIGAARRLAVDAALMGLAEFCTFRLQHGPLS